MIVLLKIATITFALLFLIRLKVDLGLILLLDTILTAVLFGMPFGDLIRQSGSALVAGETLNLVGILIAPFAIRTDIGFGTRAGIADH